MKFIIAILFSVISLPSLGVEHIDEQPKNNFTFGFALSNVEALGYELPDNPIGFNFKYRYDFNEQYGIISSFTYSGLDEYYNTSIGNTRLRLDYYSYSIGPTLRANKYFSVYGLVGVASGEITGNYAISGNTLSETERKTEFVYGGGLQVDVNENLTLDASIEYTNFDEIEAKTFTIGAGYRF
ncbi:MULTISPECIES: Ail/Lom family outer membrane beta-barrel protein [unclassified Vibrio]|uniref:Ail/Lom family outer membrane beta-barrel protein n=1 Tax=unclassified Vibrio TaxID=2614977 RepID=UPI000B8ED0D9|nr:MULTISPECIES: Ail/Lom family outer membrane beta-barrel protein [unclassified Vibrio]NAX17213.1 outer membrane beta-barrel protein [Vibrio sp. V22_P2S10T140]OXX49993.1 hypothetical protein B9J83_00765 [Vibrio sp. V07_P2A8T137]OXX58613.1 hypothetical protein B9J82_07910 [Vibrio sp. V10_P2A27P122]PSD43289.1 autotransporter outer membrane beta-barrel domain-containing protein [Vibrio sp. V02_P2A34T13]